MAQDVAKLNDPKFYSVIQVDEDVSFVLDNRDIEFAVANIPSEKALGMSRYTDCSMAQDITKLNDPKFCSVIQVDEDVSFVVDNRDIQFGVANIPSEKSLGMSRKTYSKKHPIAFNTSVLLSEGKVNSNGNNTPKKSILKNSPKCSSTSPMQTVKENYRKRPLDSASDISKNPVPKKVRRKEISTMQTPPAKFNGRIIDRNRSVRVPSPDSDVEILDVIVQNSSRAVKRDSDSFYGKERNKLKMTDIQRKKNSKSMSNILKPCYPTSDDVPITEADIAPNIPSNSVIPDTSVSETNQDTLNSQSTNEWFMTTAASVSSSVQNSKSCSAKGCRVESSAMQNVSETEIKSSPEKKPTQKRELKNLYANLNEIYWAKQKDFQQLLSNADHRHSERITAKAADVGKSLRRLKANSGNKVSLSSNTQRKTLANKNSAKLALKRAKYGRPRPNLVLNKVLKSKPSVNRVNKKLVKKPVLKTRKNVKESTRNAKIQPKVGIKSKTATVLKKKHIPTSSAKTIKSVGSKIKGDHSPPNTAKSSILSALKKIKTENTAQESPKNSNKRYVKEVEYRKQVVMGKKCGDKIYSTAMTKGSKLRVEVEPLEHTDLWNSTFYQAFSNYVLDQSSSQLNSKSKESIKAMFDELMETWFQNQPENIKRKKPEEETLRSSVRQSECAFRYKEIVVKKHENYMQFILVPNAVKQNSLSIEAMRELRDAFLLAKKDSNCRAVLLNSSGTFFCTGIDLSQLIGNNKKQAAEEMSATIKDLVLTISTFMKPVVAAVNGIAVGFGVTLLTLCDVVLASDKATFCIPATSLGYLPEGAVTLTLPQVVGSTMASELLLYGRRLTADQALRHGLVSEVLWHSNLMNEVVPRIRNIVKQPAQVMEATKTLVRCQLWDRLKFHMEREWRLLPPLWLDAQCQNNIKKALQTGWLFD